MSLEKLLVIGYVFYGYDMLFRHFDHLVDEQEGITVRKLFFDAMNIEYWRLVGIIGRHLLFVLMLF